MSTSVKVNGRFYAHRPTGMQRYAIEVSRRFPARARLIRPERPLKGAIGHAWEQLYLPLATGGDLLWSPNNTGPLAVTRQVCTIHDLIPLDHPEWFSPNFVSFYRWLFPRLASRLRHVIAISQFTKQRIIELLHIDEKRITVIPNGVDSQFRPPNSEQVSELRRKLALGEKPYALCVGSLEPRKNLKGLLAAWTILPEHIRRDYQLVIAGAKGSSKVFREANLGEIPSEAVFTGYVAQEDLPVLYGGAGAFIYPSLYEGFGLPPLEAMACGTPVVVSRASSIPEVVGNSATLADPHSIEDLAAGIEQTLTNEAIRKRQIQEGLGRAQALTWDSTAQQTWALLEQQAAC